MTHLKIAQKTYIFSREFRTFPVTEGNEIRHFYFQFTTPARKLTHNMKFEHFWMQKDTNFGNTINIRHFGPENRQKSNPERHEFWQHHNYSSLWARESPKSNPEGHEFQEHHNYSSPWARELPKSNPERHEFQGNALIDPSKNANK